MRVCATLGCVWCIWVYVYGVCMVHVYDAWSYHGCMCDTWYDTPWYDTSWYVQGKVTLATDLKLDPSILTLKSLASDYVIARNRLEVWGGVRCGVCVVWVGVLYV